MPLTPIGINDDNSFAGRVQTALELLVQEANTGKFDKTGGTITGAVRVDPGGGGDIGLLVVDASDTTVDVAPIFLISTPNTGQARVIQANVPGDAWAWLSVERAAGGAGKPGIALGPGGATIRDTNLYRDAANVLRTDDQFVAGGGINANNQVVTGVPTPTQDTHAANKAYVDANAGTGGTAPTLANIPAGSTITVLKSGGTWPARPTSRTDVVVQWKGADPSPTIVASGTGGMLDNVDIRLVTP